MKRQQFGSPCFIKLYKIILPLYDVLISITFDIYLSVEKQGIVRLFYAVHNNLSTRVRRNDANN